MDVITIPGIRGDLAVGLTWEHEPTKPNRATLRGIAERGGRWGVVRRVEGDVESADTYQVGHGDLQDGLVPPKGSRALAAMVANHHQSPWLGLYTLDDDTAWLIAVTRNGDIIPQGDRIGTPAEMTSLRDSFRAHQEWREDEGDLSKLVTMVALAGKHPPLRDLQAGAPRALIAAAVGSALAVCVAGYAVHMYQLKKANEAVRAAETARLAAEALRNKLDAVAAIPPWTGEPAADTVVSACSLAWSGRQLARQGWTVQTWSCDRAAAGVTVSTGWLRTGGVAANAPGRLIDADHSFESESVALSLEPAQADALPADEGVRALWTLAQEAPFQLILNAETVPTPTSGRPPRSVPWRQQDALLTMPAPPWTFDAVAFNSVVGLRVSRVAFDTRSGAWTVSGKLNTLTNVPLPMRARADTPTNANGKV